MIKILVADDHPVVRQGIMRIIEESPDMTVAGEAGNGQEVLKKVQENDYDMVLLDISMPVRDGMEIMEDLKKMKRNLPVLVLTIHPEKNYAIRMFKAGASGYLTKERAPYELIEAIRLVARGKKYVSPAFAEVLNFSADMDTAKPAHQALSKREFQTMCMIADGKTVRDIARELSLSVKTVSTHRTNLLAKMNMKSNAEIIRYVIENRLSD